MSDINGRLTEEVGLLWYQDCGRRLDPAQNQVAILHFGKKKVESAKYGAVLFGG